MDSSVSGKDEIWFLHVCHHVPNELYYDSKIQEAVMDWACVLVNVTYIGNKQLGT